MSTFSTFIRQQMRTNSALMVLLFINIGVFVLVKLVLGALVLFNINGADFIYYLSLPASVVAFLSQPWTALTYMFLHKEFFHLFTNMLFLYWFGKVFLETFNEKQLIGVYLLGGLAGGGVYMLAYNIFPYFAAALPQTILMGASASVMAITLAAATAQPARPLRLLFIGEVKLIYLALISVAISMLSVTSSNAGGEFAHLGGALLGFLFAFVLRRGFDMSRPIAALIAFFSRLFSRSKRAEKPKFHYVKSDEDFNQEKAKDNAEMDAILDKIRKSGYGSLSKEEKQRLFDTSQKL